MKTLLQLGVTTPILLLNSRTVLVLTWTVPQLFSRKGWLIGITVFSYQISTVIRQLTGVIGAGTLWSRFQNKENNLITTRACLTLLLSAELNGGYLDGHRTQFCLVQNSVICTVDEKSREKTN